MKLAVIQSGIERFSKRLDHSRTSPIAWLYHKQDELHEVDYQKDIAAFLHNIFSSEDHVRHWKRKGYRPAEVMEHLAETESQNIGLAFSLLFDHQKSVETRIDQFQFFLDQLLQERKANDLGFIESATFQDTACLSYYLTMRHGDQYTLYRHDVFQKTMHLLSPEKPVTVEDYTRYLKVCKIIQAQFDKDQSIYRLHRKRFNQTPKEHSLLVYEFLHFLTETPFY